MQAQFMTTTGREREGEGRWQVLITSKRGSGPEGAAAAARSCRLSAYGFLMVPCVGFVANKMAHIKSMLRGGDATQARPGNCIGLAPPDPSPNMAKCPCAALY